MDLGEIQGLIDTTPEKLTDDLMEINASKLVPNEEKTQKKQCQKTNGHQTVWQKGSYYSRLHLTCFMTWTLL